MFEYIYWVLIGVILGWSLILGINDIDFRFNFVFINVLDWELLLLFVVFFLKLKDNFRDLFSRCWCIIGVSVFNKCKCYVFCFNRGKFVFFILRIWFL